MAEHCRILRSGSMLGFHGRVHSRRRRLRCMSWAMMGSGFLIHWLVCNSSICTCTAVGVELSLTHPTVNKPPSTTFAVWYSQPIQQTNLGNVMYFLLENGADNTCVGCEVQSPYFNVRAEGVTQSFGLPTFPSASAGAGSSSSSGAAVVTVFAGPSTTSTSTPTSTSMSSSREGTSETGASQTQTSAGQPSSTGGGGGAGAAGQQSSPGSSSDPSSNKSLNLKMGLGLGLGVGILGLAGFIAVLVVCLRRRRFEKQRQRGYAPTGSGNWTKDSAAPAEMSEAGGSSGNSSRGIGVALGAPFAVPGMTSQGPHSHNEYEKTANPQAPYPDDPFLASYPRTSYPKASYLPAPHSEAPYSPAPQIPYPQYLNSATGYNPIPAGAAAGVRSQSPGHDPRRDSEALGPSYGAGGIRRKPVPAPFGPEELESNEQAAASQPARSVRFDEANNDYLDDTPSAYSTAEEYAAESPSDAAAVMHPSNRTEPSSQQSNQQNARSFMTGTDLSSLEGPPRNWPLA